MSDQAEPEACRGNQDLIEVDYRIICRSCGQTHNETLHNNGLIFMKTDIEFTKQSIYIRKYHVQNALSDIKLEKADYQYQEM